MYEALHATEAPMISMSPMDIKLDGVVFENGKGISGQSIRGCRILLKRDGIVA